jgi:hypothetical protein
MVGPTQPPFALSARRHDDRDAAPFGPVEIAMRHPIDVERRTLLVAGSVLGLAAVLRPQRVGAQPADGKLRIGTIGAGASAARSAGSG